MLLFYLLFFIKNELFIFVNEENKNKKSQIWKKDKDKE